MAKIEGIPSRAAAYIEPMECLPVTELPEGLKWTYEIKLDGYRLEAVKDRAETILYSRHRNVLNHKFPDIAQALAGLPEATVVDGELVALDSNGRPNFNLLQNFRAQPQIMYYAFDLLVHRGRDLTRIPLAERRSLLQTVIKPSPHVDLSHVTYDSTAITEFVREEGLEGVVAKRADSVYQPGRRTGLWRKERISRSREFVIGGYIPSHLGIDSLVVGFYRGKDLIYAGRVRAGFVPVSRRTTLDEIKHLKIAKCPFSNLPQMDLGRWGQGLTIEKMNECVWLKPVAVAQIEFLEWTGADYLRHPKFVALLTDKDARKVVTEPD